jgi:hypothetical protein
MCHTRLSVIGKSAILDELHTRLTEGNQTKLCASNKIKMMD